MIKLDTHIYSDLTKTDTSITACMCTVMTNRDTSKVSFLLHKHAECATQGIDMKSATLWNWEVMLGVCISELKDGEVEPVRHTWHFGPATDIEKMTQIHVSVGCLFNMCCDVEKGREILNRRNFHVLQVVTLLPLRETRTHIRSQRETLTHASALPPFSCKDCRLSMPRQQVPAWWLQPARGETFGSLLPTLISSYRAWKHSWPGCPPQTPGGMCRHRPPPSH